MLEQFAKRSTGGDTSLLHLGKFNIKLYYAK